MNQKTNAQILKDAFTFLETNAEKLIDSYIVQKNVIPNAWAGWFMAGSPGAGKTEFATRYLEQVNSEYVSREKSRKQLVELLTQESSREYERLMLKIDVDELREFFPQYLKTIPELNQKGNAEIIQPVANRALDIIKAYCLENSIPFLLDGTLGNQYSTCKKLVKKLLRENRDVTIFYLYLDPIYAWDFTQAREQIEGRNVTQQKFIDQFFKSKDNVRRLKQDFGDKISLHCILKDRDNKIVEISHNHKDVDNFLKEKYNNEQIEYYYPDANSIRKVLDNKE